MLASQSNTSAPKRLFRGLAKLGVAGVLLLASSCQFLSNINMFPPDQDVTMGLQAYEEILANEPVIPSGPQVDMVREVMNRLVDAARAENPELVEMFAWEVRLIDNDQMVNAFCLPGGKMAVYTGILPVAETDTGLAVVMGHEIAHALERHGTEAVTRQYGIQGLLTILTSGKGEQLSGLAGSLLGLKFGRNAELEADRSGLRYMARAGYNPQEAVAFWQRMASGAGASPPEWLSTHPANSSRISQLQELMPEAMALYQAGGAPQQKTNPRKWQP